ncbi:hypothetical protein [Trichormus azollae]|uniref:hypothetical protein n=1 Tax=Trichormus azollae TaxID=1164 RepID=UPI00325DB756
MLLPEEHKDWLAKAQTASKLRIKVLATPRKARIKPPAKVIKLNAKGNSAGIEYFTNKAKVGERKTVIANAQAI